MDIGNTDQLCIIAALRLRFSTTQSIHMHKTIQLLLQGWVRFYPTDELMLIHKGVPSEKPQPIIIIPTHWSMHATSYTLSELG